MPRRSSTHPRSPARLPVRRLLATLFGAVLLVASPGVAEPIGAYHDRVDHELFPLPEELVANVEFWRSIFATYTTKQELVHDEVYLDVVYTVLDFHDLDSMSDVAAAKVRARRVKDERARVSAILGALASGAESSAAREEVARIEALWAHHPEGRAKYGEAARHVRSQRGLRDHMARAIEISGMFMPGIEEALARHGVPQEARCMPFVESMFNYKARSKVGASGAWQFTAATGRLFLNIDSAVDERSDVLLAADGAARLLESNHERLQSWPLALTAYNHGAAGIARAVRKTGTRDMGVIARSYQSRTFGFASRNFYASFLGALLVYLDREQYFPGVEPLPPLQFEVFEAPRFVSLPELAGESTLDMAVLEELNPALSRQVISGSLFVPTGYPMRVPLGSLARVKTAYASLDEQVAVFDRQNATSYRVRGGDTLGSIARRFGTTVGTLQRANNLPQANRIYIGQLLDVPQTGRPPARTASTLPSQPPPSGLHVVAPGESVHAIAIRYGVSTSELVALTQLENANMLRVGQKLAIPESAGAASNQVEAPGHHVVRHGDTLSTIAVAYGTSVESLQQLNSLRTSLIRVGQTLLVPHR